MELSTVRVEGFAGGAFEIATTPVTQAQYEAVVGTNPSYFKDRAGSPDRPVECVSWYDAVAFCNALSKRDGLTPAYDIRGTDVQVVSDADGWRLPTEAEWEYAAKGGNKTHGYVYAGSDDPDEVAWYVDNSNGETHPVAQKKPNELGLYDMSGNVWEWSQDEWR